MYIMHTIPLTLENTVGLNLYGKMKMKYTGTPSSIMPKATIESTGASMSGRITSNTAANNISIGIGRNTYIRLTIDDHIQCTYIATFLPYTNSYMLLYMYLCLYTILQDDMNKFLRYSI